jgi:hypothetical protein
MKTYTIYNTLTESAVAQKKKRPAKEGSEIEGLSEGLVFLEEIETSRPSFDPWSEKTVPDEVVYDLVALTATQNYSVSQLTEEEISEITPDFYETLGGIKMGVLDTDQNSFANLLALLNQSGEVDETMIAIKDIYGVSNALSVGDYKIACVSYGQYCYTLFLAE